MRYDRAKIMRSAHQIKKERGIPFGEAMRMAWAEAKAATPALPAVPHLTQQPGGIDAALRRYGIDATTAVRLADRAKAALARAASRVHAHLSARRQPALTGPRDFDARRRPDGSWDI